jgi:hypothetical protein
MATAIKINRLTPEQAAYLAGLIDGEGTSPASPASRDSSLKCNPRLSGVVH